MKSKTILILGNYPPPFGGVPRHIECLIPYLVDKGWKVHVLSGGNIGIEYKKGFSVYKPDRWSKRYYLIKSLCRAKKKGSFNFNALRRRYPKKWLYYKTYISYARKIIETEQINLISAYNLYNYAPIGAVLSDEYNIPLVVTNFGEIFSMTNYFLENLDLVKYVCHHSKKLLAMSCNCAQSYKLLNLAPDVEVIPYGVDVTKFSLNKDGSKIRNKVGVIGSNKVVLFVGRLIADMGLHTLLEAIPKVLKNNSQIKFIIVGQKTHSIFCILESLPMLTCKTPLNHDIKQFCNSTRSPTLIFESSCIFSFHTVKDASPDSSNISPSTKVCSIPE